MYPSSSRLKKLRESLRSYLSPAAWLLLGASTMRILATQVSGAQPPAISLDNPSQVSGAIVVITGTVNPNGQPAGYSLQWGTSIAYDHFRFYVPLPAQNTPVAISTSMTYLTANTLYHYQLVATNAAGMSLSPDMTVTTSADPAHAPIPTANAATDVTTTSATISGTVDPGGLFTGAFVVWGMTTAYNHSAFALAIQTLTGSAPVTTTINGLLPDTVYHYAILGTNAAGNGYSADMTLTTLDGSPLPLPPPSATTGAASSIGADSAQLAGTLGPSVSEAVWFFRWGTNAAYGNGTPLGQVYSNSAQTAVSASLVGLSPGTTYHYQLVATNSAGVNAGTDMTFITLGAVSIGSDRFIYTVTNGSVTILGYKGPGGTVAIPDTIAGLPVTMIDTYAFDNVGLTSVSIPEGVTTIGASAFGGNLNLTNVTLPKTLTDIGSNAFAGCQSLPGISIPEGVTTIGASTFDSDFSLTNVSLPKTLTGIDQGAFYGCRSLSSISIPDNVASIGSTAFWYCSGLASVNLGNNLRTIGDAAFSGCSALTQVIIPDSVTNLPDATGYFVPEGVFSFCNNLTNVIIGKGLEYLGVGTFTECYNLYSLLFRGDAPPFGAYDSPFYMDPFFGTTNVTVYYLPGTTGWGATYSGRPAVLWTSPLITTDATLGVQQGRFGFYVSGTPGIPVVIEASTNLAPPFWAPLQTCTLFNGAFRFSDPRSTNYPARFYRIRSP